jgi:hypothetical protein
VVFGGHLAFTGKWWRWKREWRRDVTGAVRVLYGRGPPRGFSQVFILQALKVLCFDTLLQVLILNGLVEHFAGP